MSSIRSSSDLEEEQRNDSYYRFPSPSYNDGAASDRPVFEMGSFYPLPVPAVAATCEHGLTSACGECLMKQFDDYSPMIPTMVAPGRCPPAEPRPSADFLMSEVPQHDKFRDLAAAGFVAKRLLSDFIKQNPISGASADAYIAASVALFERPLVADYAALLSQGESLVENFLEKDPRYYDAQVDQYPLDTTPPNYDDPQSDLDYLACTWMNPPERVSDPCGATYFLEWIADLRTVPNSRIRLFVPEDDLYERLKWVFEDERFRVDRSNVTRGAHGYVFNRRYEYSHHCALINAFGFGWLGRIDKLDTPRYSIRPSDLPGSVDVKYYCRRSRRRKLEERSRMCTMPELSHFINNVPGCRVGSRTAAAWDFAKVVKPYQGGKRFELGGKWNSPWSEKVGLMWTVQSRYMAEREFTMVGKDGAFFTSADHAKIFDVPHGVHNAGYTCDRKPGDELCHWAMRVSYKGVVVRVATPEGYFDRSVRVDTGRRCELYGWAILRNKVLYNPICYARTDRDPALRGIGPDTVLSFLGYVGGVAFDVLYYDIRPPYGKWVFPAQPSWLVCGNSLVCPISPSSGNVLCISCEPYYCPPPHSLAWASFLVVTRLSSIVPPRPDDC